MSFVEFYFENISPVNINQDFISAGIEQLIVNEKKNTGDITIVFCSDDYLLEMNKQYLNHDYKTEIQTFNYVSGDLISGDLFISIDRVKENAAKFEVHFKEELYRVVFHGVLHLIGYNDKSDPEKQIMRNKENEYLGKIDFSKKER